MGTPNTAARNEAANDFAADYGTATLTLFVGATAVAVHTLAGFGAAASGVITANAIADATFTGGGTIDGCKLVAGGLEYDLTVGTSGTDVVISTLTAVENGTSSVSSMQVTF